MDAVTGVSAYDATRAASVRSAPPEPRPAPQEGASAPPPKERKALPPVGGGLQADLKA